MREINPIQKIQPELLKPESRAETKESGFMERLSTAIKQVNDQQQEADRAIEQVVTGSLGIHEGMLRVQEADISMRLLLQVRRRAMEAYNEIIHMSF